MGKTLQQIRDETNARRQKILNCKAYREGDRFGNAEAARVMKCPPKAVYHILDEMVKANLLQSHKYKNSLTYSKPGVDWLQIPWRAHSNKWIYT